MEAISWKKVLFDVEVYKNVFLCSIKNVDTKEIIKWEVSSRKNDIEQVRLFFKNFKNYLISFNGIHYDNCIILFLLKNNFANWNDLTLKTKEFSDIVITTDFWWNRSELKKFKYQNQWIDIDLFCYWSKMLRMSKKVSLKGLAIQLGYHTVQELPFDPATELNHKQIDELSHYNSVHDLGILEMLFAAFSEKLPANLGPLGTVQLRYYIKTTYGLDCMSWDAPKIASELLLKEYCDLTNSNTKEIKNFRFEHTEKLELPPIKFELDCFKEVYRGMSEALNEYSRTVVLLHGDTSIKLTYGKGGLHSVNSNESYFEDDDYFVITSDVASLYPNLIINYKLFRFLEVLQIYTKVKSDRIVAKKNKDKTMDTFLKLILNGTSGLIDNEYSWLYYPEGAMKLRLMGQLILTLSIERLVLKGFKVISANTDGIEAIVPKNRIEEYYAIVNQVGKEFDLEFEHENYKKIVYQNVNSYIAQTEGKVKQKGLFVEKPELGSSVDYLVIPKALNAYYINGVQPEKFVREHKNILDFCCSQKVDKSYTIQWTSPDFKTEKQQRLDRFYASTKGGYIYKVRNGKLSHLLKQSGVMIYNNHKEEFPTDINYKFYINEIKGIINDINRNNQISMF